MPIKNLLSAFILLSLLAACNLPISQPAANPDVIGTAVELTAAAKLTEMAGSVTPAVTASPTFTATVSAPTQCSPLVTAAVNANVRSGPGTAYDIVGALNLGQTATVAGRNDASTWWYIDYPAGSGNHAWIAGSVTTASCLPVILQVVAAPPLPTAEPRVEAPETDEPDDDDPEPEAGGGAPVLPDLVADGMQVVSGSADGYSVLVQVRVRNRGEAAAGSFSVDWRAMSSAVGCTWTVPSLAPGASKSLSCSYTYLKSCTDGSCSVVLVVDPGNQVVEANESNNNQQDSYRQIP